MIPICYCYLKTNLANMTCQLPVYLIKKVISKYLARFISNLGISEVRIAQD